MRGFNRRRGGWNLVSSQLARDCQRFPSETQLEMPIHFAGRSADPEFVLPLANILNRHARAVRPADMIFLTAQESDTGGKESGTIDVESVQGHSGE